METLVAEAAGGRNTCRVVICPLRVVVTGSESTGKTTLAERLAEHYGTICVPEFSRAYAQSAGRELTADDVEPIARGQLANERRAELDANRLLVLDTDVLSTVVYGTHYYGDAPAWISETLREHPADLYLLCDIDVPWVADPARDRGHMRPEMHALFVDAVRGTGVSFVLIRGGWEERFRVAVDAIDALLARAGIDADGAAPLPPAPSPHSAGEGVNFVRSGRGDG
ncbi:MAG TPA: ATP-binding protein [Longimicrobium sp.]|nr:ATP-binding protein [Longimicrobium sp.]